MISNIGEPSQTRLSKSGIMFENNVQGYHFTHRSSVLVEHQAKQNSLHEVF